MDSYLTRREVVKALCAGVAFLPVSVRLMAASALPQASTSSLSFRFDPLIDLYFLLQKQALDDAEPLPEWRDAVGQMRVAAEYLPGNGDLSLMNGIICGFGSVAELSQAIERMPKAAAGRVPTRDVLKAIAAGLTAAEPVYEKETGPAHRKLVEEALHGTIEPGLVPDESRCLSFILSRLGIADVGFEVPVFLVASAPEPGAITNRSRQMTAACFVSVRPFAGSTLFEAILHEAAHALEAAAGPESLSVLTRLSEQLTAQGVQPGSPLLRDVPHTLAFVQSAETVRRFLDPAHVPYGVSHGYYAKVPRIAPVVQEVWVEHLDGRLSTDAAVERIVAGVVHNGE